MDSNMKRDEKHSKLDPSNNLVEEIKNVLKTVDEITNNLRKARQVNEEELLKPTTL